MNNISITNISGVDCYEKDGIAYLKLETVARGLGFTQTQIKNGKEYISIRWERVEQYLEEIDFPHKWGKDDFIPENIFYRLAMKAKNETAEKFQAKVADEIIPSIRKTGSYSTNEKNKIEQGLFAVKFIADDLRVNESSRLFMYEGYCKDVGIPTGFLPKYEYNGNRQIKAISTLLKENCCDISAVKFNQKLIEYGYVEERERPTSRGKSKKFKALTEIGLKYGENAINPYNQKEVQPLYYEDTFMELYSVIELYSGMA